MVMIEVRGAPNYYACKEGALNGLPAYLLNHSLSNSIVIHGEKSWSKAKSFIPPLPSASFEKYKGECSTDEILRFSEMVKDRQYDSIIGVGGGKVLDLAKAVGNECSIPVILIPTLPSTCAAWTPLSVIYNHNGEYLHYTVYKKSTLAVFLEPKILLTSPVEYLRAGIGDTLAKWYEADAIIRNETSLPVPVQIAHESARLCQTTLLSYGQKAISDLQKNEITTELVRVFETVIVAGGMVGGYGDRFGRIAGAHSIHNGITRLPETHHVLHGEKVAYGILVQLMLENQQNEIKGLLPFYKKLNLPFNLDSLGIKDHQVVQAVETISAFASLPHESIHLMGREINANAIKEAIFSLESLTNES